MTAGLIKNGIKCVAWRVEEGSAALVDFEATALREGATLHNFLKTELRRANVNLTPLMLVQVDSRANSVERAKEKLLELGFRDGQIAVHTAEEPDAGLLALANDESREVLIFKMAVALGFDAPRAWTLVSMRAARDEDFGVQLVGRVLRVHRRLQGRVLPDALKYGYVLLADIDAQGGLDAAGQRINRIQTSFAAVCPSTVVFRVGERDVVQSLGADGQMTYLPEPPPGAIFTPPPAFDPLRDAADPNQPLLFATAFAPDEVRGAIRAALMTPPTALRYQYPLREDVPRRFKTQVFSEEIEISEEVCAEHFIVSADQMLESLLNRDSVRVQKLTREIFTQAIQLELGFALPSLEQMQRRAQAELSRSGVFNPRELRRALVRRLQFMLAERGEPHATDSDRLDEYLNILITQFPHLIRDAQKRAMAAAATLYETEDLPARISSDNPLRTSRLNVYRIEPPEMNSWERKFGEYLDGDDTGTVLWWHRNVPNKQYSINVLLETGSGFFPDFIVGINQRPREQNGLLADTKYAFDTAREFPKLLAEHAAYGRVLILTKNDAQRWAIAQVDETGRPRVGPQFQLANAVGF